jgi:hypothetical protein
MKHLIIKSMAGIVAMASTSISAQSMVPDEPVALAKPFKISKVKYEDHDAHFDKTFSDGSWYTLSITASGSTPVYHNTNYTYANSGCFYFNSVGSDALDTNIHLPDGHAILSMWYYYKDGSSSNSTAYLSKMDGLGNITALLTNESEGDSGNYASRAVSTAGYIVDNSKYFYHLRFRTSQAGSNQQICGVGIVMDPTP